MLLTGIKERCWPSTWIAQLSQKSCSAQMDFTLSHCWFRTDRCMWAWWHPRWTESPGRGRFTNICCLLNFSFSSEKRSCGWGLLGGMGQEHLFTRAPDPSDWCDLMPSILEDILIGIFIIIIYIIYIILHILYYIYADTGIYEPTNKQTKNTLKESNSGSPALAKDGLRPRYRSVFFS